MFQLEVLVRERLGPVDTGTARAIAVQEIPALNHKIFNLIALSVNFTQLSTTMDLAS